MELYAIGNETYGVFDEQDRIPKRFRKGKLAKVAKKRGGKSYVHNLLMQREALNHADIGDFGKAVELAKEALEITRNSSEFSKSHVAAANLVLAQIYMNMQDYENAEPCLIEATEIEDDETGNIIAVIVWVGLRCLLDYYAKAGSVEKFESIQKIADDFRRSIDPEYAAR